MPEKQPVKYYGLKEFSEFAKKEGINISTQQLSVYKIRGKLPIPTVIVGEKGGWTKKQITDWIKERKISHLDN